MRFLFEVEFTPIAVDKQPHNTSVLNKVSNNALDSSQTFKNALSKYFPFNQTTF